VRTPARGGAHDACGDLSARDSVEDLEAGRHAGATDHLVKPFSMHELAGRLVDLVVATRQHAA
jgi:DNA-binding response OmpR family regulator